VASIGEPWCATSDPTIPTVFSTITYDVEICSGEFLFSGLLLRPICYQREWTTSGSRLSQSVDEQTSVGCDVVPRAIQQRLSDCGAEEDFGIAGLDRTVRCVNRELQDIFYVDRVDRVESLTVVPPTWSSRSA